jgi:hypothetical protein
MLPRLADDDGGAFSMLQQSLGSLLVWRGMFSVLAVAAVAVVNFWAWHLVWVPWGPATAAASGQPGGLGTLACGVGFVAAQVAGAVLHLYTLQRT